MLTLVANGRAILNLDDFSNTFLIMALFPLLSLPMIFSLRKAERMGAETDEALEAAQHHEPHCSRRYA